MTFAAFIRNLFRRKKHTLAHQAPSPRPSPSKTIINEKPTTVKPIAKSRFAGKKKLVIAVQRQLPGLVPDGDPGPKTWGAITKFLKCENDILSVQDALDVSASGVDDRETWASIFDTVKIDAPEQISPNAYRLIVKYEVGGGMSYYNRFLTRPTYPGGASGVTIGVGYDLGYVTQAQFATDWEALLTPSHFRQLTNVIGKRRNEAKRVIGGLRHITIPWDAAEQVFKNETLPRYIKTTLGAFPGSEKLPPDVFGALVSLVFNRGGSVVGVSRIEMLNIRKALTEKSGDELYSYIATQIKMMKRLWVRANLPGLLARRDAEAKLVSSVIV